MIETCYHLFSDLDELDVDETAVKLHFPNPMNVLQIKLELYVREGIWAGATFEFSFDIPDSYPFKPPVVICLNKIFHPNVDVLGNVCLNLLREDWNPVRDINQCIWGIQQLFDSPNPIDPLNKDAATLLRDNPYMFSRVVRSTLSGEMYQNETYSKLI